MMRKIAERVRKARERIEGDLGDGGPFVAAEGELEELQEALGSSKLAAVLRSFQKAREKMETRLEALDDVAEELDAEADALEAAEAGDE